MTKLFVIGGSGYVGSQSVLVIRQKHPDFEITCLVRNAEKAVKLTTAIPNVNVVYGDFGSLDLLTSEAAKADIILNFGAPDSQPAVEAMFKGLSSRSTPGFYIHTTGASILEGAEKAAGRYGKSTDLVFDDIKDLDVIKALPEQAWKNLHPEDLYVWSGSSKFPNVNTALMSPPTIFGPTQGPGDENSIMLQLLVKLSLERGRVFQLGDGDSTWEGLHVQDLGNIYLRLVEEAAKGGGSATWNDEGFYFAEAGEFVWKDVSAEVARLLYHQGLIKSKDIETVTETQADAELHPFASTLWGYSARNRSIRARKYLGWEPTMPGMFTDLPRVIKDETAKLGMKYKV